MKRANRRPTTPTPRRSRVANDCIDAVLRGDLTSAREIAKRNVGRCDGLASELRSIRQTLDRLQALPESPDLSDRILVALDREASERSRTTMRLSISRRFAVAAGLVIVSVAAGLFNRSEQATNDADNQRIAKVLTVSPEPSDELLIGLGDISRYDTDSQVDAITMGGSGGVLALAPQADENKMTTYQGPLAPAQAVLNVKSKSRAKGSTSPRSIRRDTSSASTTNHQ